MIIALIIIVIIFFLSIPYLKCFPHILRVAGNYSDIKRERYNFLVQAMKAYSDSSGIAPFTLNLDTRWR